MGTLASAVSMIVRPDAPTRPGPLRRPAAARFAARFALVLVGLGTLAGWAVSPAGAQTNSCAKHGCVDVVAVNGLVDGIEADVERCRVLAESSPSIVTPLNRLIGYEASARIAKHAVKRGLTIADAVRDLGHVDRGELSEEQLAAALDVTAMTGAPAPSQNQEKAPDQG